MQENRVKLAFFGRVPTDDPRLVPVASVHPHSPQRLHKSAARAFTAMRRAALRDGYDLQIVSGWRPHRWRSREHYNSHLRSRYGSVGEGRKWVAFDSPHETGLAFDLGNPKPLAPTSATVQAQRNSPVYAWLVENAERFGVTPYRREPWHWEVNVPLSEFQNPSTGRTRKVLTIAAVAVAGVVLSLLVT